MVKFSERISLYFATFFLFIFLCGKSACQEDYYLASQATAATQTPTETPTDTGDGEIITTTPTATPTEEAGPIETSEATATPTATTGVAGAAQEILSDLELLSRENDSPSRSAAGAESGSSTADAKSENWLGKSFADEDAPSSVEDTDRDGFADWLEQEVGTNPNDVRSIPLSAVHTSLQNRFQNSDRDMDGLPDAKEADNGTDSNFPDTDEDGFLDGIEVYSNTNPLDAKSKPVDSDGDGVGDDLELKQGTDPHNRDSDGDGLRDDLEIILGTSSSSPDSDGDGILDGKEYEFGSDPVISERE